MVSTDTLQRGGHSEAGGFSSRRCEALFKIDATVTTSIILGGEILALQLELGALSNTQFQMDTTRALEGNLGTTRANLEQAISEMQKAPDTVCSTRGLLELRGAKIDVIESNFSNILAILQVQKFEARCFRTRRVTRFCSIVEHHLHKLAFLLHEVV